MHEDYFLLSINQFHLKYKFNFRRREAREPDRLIYFSVRRRVVERLFFNVHERSDYGADHRGSPPSRKNAKDVRYDYGRDRRVADRLDDNNGYQATVGRVL